MPFRNSVVAAVISTALAGSRIVIDGTGALANYIRFYTGKATESAPATITGRSYGPADPSYPDALYLGLEGARHTDDPLRNPATLRLITTPGPNMALVGEADYITLQSTTQTSVRSAGVAEIDADIITLGKYSVPLTDPPALRIGAFSTLNVLGPWVPYTPTVVWSGVPGATGNSIVNGRYMKVGRVVNISMTVRTGTTWNSGGGGATFAFTLPFAPAASALTGTPRVQGVSLLVTGGAVYAVGCYIDAAGNLQGYGWVGGLGFYYGSASIPNGAGTEMSLTLTYESAT